ncbi:MAG: acetyl-CoA acetyltransferase [Alphaproteobacteria bacterium]|nr:acetyl-CoA acetyltransferase [Alphaproteobacteria bacterium]
MAEGIRDKVAIVGMGCTHFGERWEVGAEELMVEAFNECIADAGVARDQIDAAWFSNCMEEVGVGKSAMPVGQTLRLPQIPISRVENYCASGSEAFRGAVYGVASGACDIALAIGVEKLKDTGYGGLPGLDIGTMPPLWWANLSAPGSFAQLASAYRQKFQIGKDELKRAMGMISARSHLNGTKNPKAHLRKAVDLETILKSPMIAEPLGLFDCCGVSDGAACAIVTTPEIAKSLGKSPLVTVKAMQLALSDGSEAGHNSWDGSYFKTTRVASRRAYEEAGITNPREEVGMVEVHDCFSVTELVTLEDLQLSPEGGVIKDIMDGFYDADGKIPSQIDGGLKCFGHPIGASGLRMIYEVYLQLLERAEDRQLNDPRIGVTHNLGGFPHQNVCSITVLGRSD